MKTRSKIIAFFLIVILFAGLAGMTVTNIIKNINLGLDLQGGFEILYEVEPADTEQELTRDLLESTVQTLNDRVDRLGISEANIDIDGEGRIRVQLVGTSARIYFRDVDNNKLLDGTDIKEGSAKQDFDPTTNEPVVTLKLKDASKFAEVTSEIKQKTPPDNRLVIWMDFEEGDSYAK